MRAPVVTIENIRWQDGNHYPTRLILPLGPVRNPSDLNNQVRRTLEGDYGRKTKTFTHRPTRDGDSYIHPQDEHGWHTYHLRHDNHHATGMFNYTHQKGWAVITNEAHPHHPPTDALIYARNWTEFQAQLKNFIGENQQ